jgi:hypothetical protein
MSPQKSARWGWARAALIALSALLLATLSTAARAGTAPRRTAFAVVIGNNKSLEHRRPDLHYADDDAAKYFALLRTLAPRGAYLLTEFDDDTARLFPAVVPQAAPPTVVELLRVGRDLAERVHAAATAGVESDVYFVFAGHGDVDQGTGFIELADGRFTSVDLEQWLRGIPFARAHVLLDSCNSFFMLGSRRPGGRYYATSEDAARSLAARLPNVGVFLSTSAEGESFEWSEIQSGVFSHVVRSGLLGAADADGDGNVSYLELAAFVTTATADVANPNLRPHIFARGPGGLDQQPIVPVGRRSGARTFQLSDAAPLRVRVRDRASVPFLDAHQEAGIPLTLAVPEDWAEGAVVERPVELGRTAAASAGPAVLQDFAVPSGADDVTLTSLEPVIARGATRGPAEVFQRLFVRPFGPRAVAAYLAAAQTAPAAVYGVAREDAERMDLLLEQIAGAEHGRRMVGGYLGLATATYFGALGATALALDRNVASTTRSTAVTLGAIDLGLGALALGASIYVFALPRAGERLAEDYRAALRDGDYARAFALADERLQALAVDEARQRRSAGVAGGVLLLGSLAAIVGNELSHPNPAELYTFRALGGAGVALGINGIATSLFLESPIEHLTTVWRRDPGRFRVLPTASPTQGGATFGLAGTF